MVFPQHGLSQKGKAAHKRDGLTIRTSVTFCRQNKLLRSQCG